MVAFAATFLLKMAKTWGGMEIASPEWTTEPVGLGLNFNIEQVLSLARRSASLLSKVTESLNEKHLTRNIVHGINELLRRLESVHTPSSGARVVHHNATSAAGAQPFGALGIGGAKIVR